LLPLERVFHPLRRAVPKWGMEMAKKEKLLLLWILAAVGVAFLLSYISQYALEALNHSTSFF
jgi:hypothetical protein